MQHQLSDFMEWYEAAAFGLLFCDLCGSQIKYGYTLDSKNRKICSKCMLERY